MSRAGRLVLTVAAAVAAAAWWARRGDDADVPSPPARHAAQRATKPAVRRVPSDPLVALAPPAPRPGRRVSFFRARSRGTDLAKIARDLVAENRRELGLDAMPGELRVESEFDSLAGHHLRMEQTVGGVPVFGSEVSAHVAADGRPLLVQADVWPVEGARTAPDVAAGPARAAAVAWISDDDDPAPAESKPPVLVVLPEGRRGRLAWRVDVRTDADSARVFVDAADGAVLRADSLRVAADGKGAVFDPNPVYTLRDGSLRDAKDADSAKLTAARRIVTLPRLDGTGYLRGQWADATATQDPTSSVSLDWSSVTRSDPAFEQVMAYYHVDRAQQRLQDLGITNANAQAQRVDAHAMTADQSYFDAFNNVIRLGDGGVDDGEDADIIRHEYGHAIQFAQVRDWGVTEEGAAMGEGFGDFHAASYHSGDPLFDPLVASWDATSYSKADPPYLRRVDETKHYPEDIKSEPHADGEIWSRFLWDLRALVGDDDSLRLVVESHFLLTPSAKFPQGANAVLLTNESLRGGKDDVAIRDLLEARGLYYTVPLADPPADDAFEPNDDVDHPAPLAAGHYPNLVAADDDWYLLAVPPDRRWHVTMTYVPGRANLELALSQQMGATSATIEEVAVSENLDGTQTVDASAGPDGGTFLLRVHDGNPGTHVAAYDLDVVDTDLPALVPGHATLASLTHSAPRVFAVDVRASKIGRRLRVASERRAKHGTAPEVRVVAPSGRVAVEFGAGADRGSHAGVTLDETGAWVVEVRSRTGSPGGVKLRADFR
jgi:hypothetical protein